METRFNHEVILLLIPFYSLMSISNSTWVNTHSKVQIILAIRSAYEAILIVSFFHLIVAYVCYKEGTGIIKERIYYILVKKGRFEWALGVNWIINPIQTRT